MEYAGHPERLARPALERGGTGYTERGTVAHLVTRWLALPWNIKMGCSLVWV